MESKYKEMRHATLETGAGNRRKKKGGGAGQAGQHKPSSLGKGPTMSPGSQRRAVITLIWRSIPSHTSRAVKLSRKSGIRN